MAPAHTRDPEARIAALREAAAAIILEAGPSSLTHRAAAARAEVALGTATKYFPQIDGLRRSALEFLAADIEKSATEFASLLADAEDPIACIADVAADEPGDAAQVRTVCALSFAGLFDEELRDLSLLWHRRTVETLSPYLDAGRAEAISQYLDGVILSTALSGEMPPAAQIRRVVLAIAGAAAEYVAGDGADPA